MRPELENTALRLEAQLAFHPYSLRKVFVIRYLDNSRGGLETHPGERHCKPYEGEELLAFDFASSFEHGPGELNHWRLEIQSGKQEASRGIIPTPEICWRTPCSNKK
jgi:hypothetical protein